MTGGGFGGCTVTLVKKSAVEKLTSYIKVPHACYAIGLVFSEGLMCLSIEWKLYTCRNSNREQLRKIHQP